MPQHRLHLLTRHTGEPFKKIVDSRAVFEILEQGPDWNAGAFEQPFAAAFFRRAFDGQAFVPIECHGSKCNPYCAECNPYGRPAYLPGRRATNWA